MKLGIPQGSILRPILIDIFTNDLSNLINSLHKIACYTDDTNLFNRANIVSSVIQN